MKFLLKWWWPSYALLFPLILLPSASTGFASDFTLRFLLNLIAIFGGFFLELLAHPAAKLSDVKAVPKFLKNHPAIILALLYGSWVFASGFFSSNPERALTGTSNSMTLLPIGVGSSVWEISFVFVFILIYLRVLNDLTVRDLILKSILLSCSVISVLAITETITKHSIFTGVDNVEGQLPFVTFPGRGHLAGFLCIGLGLANYFLNKDKIYQIPVYLICCAIGATQNRSSLIALIAILVVLMLSQIKVRFWIAAFSLTAFGAGYLLSQEVLYKDQNIVFRTQGNLSSGRSILWQSALNGIAKKPVFGWGGEVFQSYWADNLTKAELQEFFRLSGFGGEYVEHLNGFFILRDKNQKLVYKTMIIWYAHNGFLDKSLSYGIVGSLLYLALLLYASRVSWGVGVAMGVIAYQVFLLAWFPTESAHGSYWSLLAVACVGFRKPTQAA